MGAVCGDIDRGSAMLSHHLTRTVLLDRWGFADRSEKRRMKVKIRLIASISRIFGRSPTTPQNMVINVAVFLVLFGDNKQLAWVQTWVPVMASEPASLIY